MWALAVAAAFAAQICWADPLIAPGESNKGEMKDELLSELTANMRRGHNEQRLVIFEEALRPMYNALPKQKHGNVGHGTARYALHRFFVERHGWTIAGLEPAGDAADADKSPKGALMKWMPTYLVDAVEKIMGTNGVDLRELAVLAAIFEDLIHKEAIGRLEELYDMLEYPVGERIDEHKSEKLVTAYMAMYTSGGNETVRTIKDLEQKRAGIDKKTRAWLKRVIHQVADAESQCDAASGECGKLDFAAATRVVEEIGEQYGPFNDEICQDLKSTLLKAEDQGSGRVKINDFYKVALHGSWNFTETPDYLRDLGALDESDGEQRVLIPNYVSSRPNCLAASTIYMICCRNECESMLGKLEAEVDGHSAPPARIVELISGMKSGTVDAPRTLPPSLVSRLDEVAAEGGFGGEVKLHGRAFADWMNEAFPRECPKPHTAGHLGPQTPDEWMKEKPEPGDQKARPDEINRVKTDAATLDDASRKSEDSEKRPSKPKTPEIIKVTDEGRRSEGPPGKGWSHSLAGLLALVPLAIGAAWAGASLPGADGSSPLDQLNAKWCVKGNNRKHSQLVSQRLSVVLLGAAVLGFLGVLYLWGEISSGALERGDMAIEIVIGFILALAAGGMFAQNQAKASSLPMTQASGRSWSDSV